MDKKEIAELKIEINMSFNLPVIKDIYAFYLSQHLTYEEIKDQACKEEDTLFGKIQETPGQRLLLNKASKEFLVNLYLKFLTDETLLVKLLNGLQPHIKQIVNDLVWGQPFISLEELNENFALTPEYHTKYAEIKQLKAEFSIFNVIDEYENYERNYFLILPKLVAQQFKKYLPKPESFYLHETVPELKDHFVFEANDDIFEIVNSIYALDKKGILSYSVNAKHLKANYKSIEKVCPVKEFFKDKNIEEELTFLRKWIITQIINPCYERNEKEHIVYDENTIIIIKQIFDSFFSGNGLCHFSLFNLLTHLKKTNTDFYATEKPVRNSLKTILCELPLEQWVSIENIDHYAQNHQLKLNIFEGYFAKNHLFFIKDTSSNYQNKQYITKKYFQSALILPTIKAACFLFSSFGLLDIAYKLPKNTIAVQQKIYLTPFDCIEYVRLTKLGEYIIGKSDNYEFKLKKQDYKVFLDSDRLIVRIIGDNPLLHLTLEQIAIKINDSCYRISFDSFMKNCDSQIELEKRIKRFLNEITDTLPQIWNDFFIDIKNRISPISREDDYCVLKIKPIKELLDIISKDTEIRNNVKKAENYYLIVKKSYLKKFIKKLKDNGYYSGISNYF